YGPVIANCSELARLFSKPEPVDFLGELLWERAKALSPQHRAQAAELLEGCARLADRQPAVIVRLIETLTGKGVLAPAPAVLQPGQPEPEICAQHLLLSAGQADPAIVPRALEYSRVLLAPLAGANRCAVIDHLTQSCQF